MCVALPEILTNSSQHNIAQWLALCNVCIWDISVLWPENSQLHPSSDLHGRAPCKGNHPLWGPQLLWCWLPRQVLQIFPLGDENSFSQFLPFLPSGGYKCQSAGSFVLPSACYQAWHSFILEGTASPCAMGTEREEGRGRLCRSSRMRGNLAMKLCGWFHVCKLELGSRSLL